MNAPSHRATVDAWIGDSAKLPPRRRLARFDLLLSALWARARRTLGVITVSAIVDRVITTIAEQFPRMPKLTVDGDAWRRLDPDARVPEYLEATLDTWMSAALVEFLEVIGSLTADVLTPALHAVVRRHTTSAQSSATTDTARQPRTLTKKRSR